MRKQPEITAKTRAKIMDAFWNLYREYGIEKITVGTIMKSAQLNRGTFYEYFTDIYDLLNQFEDQLLDDFALKTYEYFSTEAKDPFYFPEVTRGLVKIFAEYEEEFFLLLFRDSNFRTKLKEKIRERMVLTVGIDGTEPRTEYYLTFLISSLTGLMEYWYAAGKNLSTEALLEMAQELIFNGVRGCLKRYDRAVYDAWVAAQEKSIEEKQKAPVR